MQWFVFCFVGFADEMTQPVAGVGAALGEPVTATLVDYVVGHGGWIGVGGLGRVGED